MGSAPFNPVTNRPFQPFHRRTLPSNARGDEPCADDLAGGLGSRSGGGGRQPARAAVDAALLETGQAAGAGGRGSTRHRRVDRRPPATAGGTTTAAPAAAAQPAHAATATTTGDSAVPVTELRGPAGGGARRRAADVRFPWPAKPARSASPGRSPTAAAPGAYTFAPDAATARHGRRSGYPRRCRASELLRLAVIDVTTAFVARHPRAPDSPALTLDELIRFRIHGVSGAVIRELAALGLQEPRRPTRWCGCASTARRRSGSARSSAPGLAAAVPDDVVRLRIHGVTPDFIAGLKIARLHRPRRRRLHADAHPRRVARARSTRWPAAGYARAGRRRAGASSASTACARASSATCAALGFTTADEDDLVKMRIHNVSAEFVREARADGLRIDIADDAVDLAIHGRRWRRR